MLLENQMLLKNTMQYFYGPQSLSDNSTNSKNHCFEMIASSLISNEILKIKSIMLFLYVKTAIC